MSRLLRTVYTVSYVYLPLTLFAVIVTGVDMPLLSYLCLLSGVLLALLPAAFERFADRKTVFSALGALAALLGFLPILLYACPVIQYIAYALGVAAGVVFCVVRRSPMSRVWFLHVFRISLGLMGAAVAVLLLMVLPMLRDSEIVAFGKERIRLATDNIIPVMILLLATGVLLLRQMRSEQGGIDPQTIKQRQMRDLSIFGSLVGVTFVIHLFVRLRIVVTNLYDKVFYPLFVWIAGLLTDLFTRQTELEDLFPAFEQAYEMPDISIFSAAPDSVPAGEPSVVSNFDLPLPDSEVVYKIILVVLIAVSVIAFCVIVISCVRRFLERIRGRKDTPGYPNETVEQITEEPQPHEEPPKKHSSDPRERMRYQYGEFLRCLRKTPVVVERTDTCGEIRRNANEKLLVEPETLNEFIDLYEKARYRQREAVTDADAYRMKTLLGKIKSDQ